MALSQLFSEELVVVDLKCSNPEEALTKLTGLLIELGYVKPEYVKSVIEREMQFPTGLPTEPFPVALAHGDPKYVMRSGIAVGILREPLPFNEMGTPQSFLSVRIIFVLAVRETEKQTIILKGLMNILSNKGAIKNDPSGK
jgi:PTS system galactitol-specific IIA component